MNEKMNPERKDLPEAELPESEQNPDLTAHDPGEPYVERPKGQRIFAWVLAGIVILGVIFYYFWIARGGKL